MYDECRHIMPSGRKCHSPALRRKAYCYYHIRIQKAVDPESREANHLAIPPIEDASGIERALAHVFDALKSPQMDTRRAGLLLYGLHIAAQIVPRVSTPGPSESARTRSHKHHGSAPPPPARICDPDQDCIQCADYAACQKYNRLDEDQFE